MKKILLIDTVSAILCIISVALIVINLMPKAEVNIIETANYESINLDDSASLPPFDEAVVLTPPEPEVMHHEPEL